MRNRLEEICDGNPSKVFFLIGINDIGNGIAIDEFISNYDMILTEFGTRSGKTKIYVQSIFPCDVKTMEKNGQNQKRTVDNIDRYNNALKELCVKKEITYIDVNKEMRDEDGNLITDYSYDGVHLNGKGNRYWMSVIRDYVLE